jgi:trimeric autotransporter adhesin
MELNRTGCIAFFIALWGASLLSCGGSTKLNSMFITPTTANIPVGVTQQFTATGNYSDASVKDITNEVSWASSNPAVATIQGPGLAIGVAPGTTTISATQGSVGTAGLTMTVNTATLTAISVTPPTPTVLLGATQQFAANGSYSDATSFNLTRQVTWRTSNAAVAPVSNTGLATAASGGTAVISATYGSVLGSTAINVSSTTLLSLVVQPAVNPGVATLPAGIKERFAALGTFSDGTTADMSSQVTWRASPTSVLFIDSTGVAVAVAPGPATVFAVSGSISASFAVTVTSAALASITVAPPAVTKSIGATQAFTATGVFADGTTYDLTTQVIWSAQPTSVAIVDANGLATAIGPGTAAIQAVSGAISGAASLTGR